MKRWGDSAMLRMQGHFDFLPAPRFHPTEDIEGMKPDEVVPLLSSSVLRGQRQLARKMGDLSAFLEEYVKGVIDAGSPFPNLTRNGNFLDTPGAAPSFLPPFWTASSPALVVFHDTPPTNVPGKAVRWKVVAGGGALRLNHRVQTTNRKRLYLSLYYKTESATEGVEVKLKETGTNTEQTVALPATGNSWRFYPTAQDEPLVRVVQDGSTSPFAEVAIGSVSAPTVTQDVSFAAASLTDSPGPCLWKPNAFDQAKCQGDLKVTTIHDLQVTAPVASDNGKFLKYNDPTGYTWDAPVAGSDCCSFTGTNTGAATIQTGDPVAVGLTSGIRKAEASDASTPSVGIATTAIPTNSSGSVKGTGYIDLPGLTANAVYYLGPTGGLTPIAPTASGQIVQPIGRATWGPTINTTRLFISIGEAKVNP